MKLIARLLICAAAGFLASGSVNRLAAEPIPDDCKIGGFALGCQAYSFNHYTVFEAIEKTAEAGGKVIEFYPGQKFSPANPVPFDHNCSDDLITQVQAQLEKYHIRAVNYGVVEIPKYEAGARKVFEFAKKLHLYGITTESIHSLDTIEPLVKEYDIRVGIHDHPRRPNDASYRNWDPNFVLSLVKDRDPRIGSCADIGHWVRSGLNPVECLQILHGRIMSAHFKDETERTTNGHCVPFGTGLTGIAAVLDELKKQNFEGNISIEYEFDWTSNVPEIAQSVGFIRGYASQK